MVKSEEVVESEDVTAFSLFSVVAKVLSSRVVVDSILSVVTSTLACVMSGSDSSLAVVVSTL